MKKTLLIVLAILVVGGYFLYDFYQSQLHLMENSIDHMMHRH